MNPNQSTRALPSMVALAAVMAGVSVSSPALAENDAHPFRFPAAMCYHTGLQPNSGAGLGNWTGSTKWAHCPLITDYDGSAKPLTNVRLYASSDTVSCYLKMVDDGGTGGWAYSWTGIEYQSGYVVKKWSTGGPWYPGAGAAIECSVPNGTMVQSYTSYTKLNDYE